MRRKNWFLQLTEYYEENLILQSHQYREEKVMIVKKLKLHMHYEELNLTNLAA